MTEEQQQQEREQEQPATSTMALSFAEVQQRLPAGVTLERSLGESVLRTRVRGYLQAVAVLVASVTSAGYIWLEVPSVALPAGVAGVVVAAVVAAGFAFGRRSITLDGNDMKVRTVPLPLPGDGTTALSAIERVEVVLTGVRAGKPGYRIDVIVNGNRRHIVHDIVDPQQALVLARYIAQEARVPMPQEPRRLA